MTTAAPSTLPPANLRSRCVFGLLGLSSYLAPGDRGLYRLVRTARGLVDRHDWRRRFRTPGGPLMDLDLATYPDCCMAFGLYEIVTARMLRRLLHPGDHFVDGGANLGYFSLMAAQRVGPHGRVDAFEPEPHNRQRLLEHVRLNQFDQTVRIHPHALADQIGRATIHYYENTGDVNHGCSSLFGDRHTAAATAAVGTVRLDESLGGAQPRVVKLDIEGAEPQAIRGMRGILSRRPLPWIIFEHNPTAARAAGTEPAAAIDALLSIQPAYHLWAMGMRLRPINPNRPRSLSRLGQVNILAEATG